MLDFILMMLEEENNVFLVFIWENKYLFSMEIEYGKELLLELNFVWLLLLL